MSVTFLKGDRFVDDRGVLKFVNDFDFTKAGIKRFYQVKNHHRGIIRAWHGHKIEEKYVYVVKGTALFGIVDMDCHGDIQKVVLSAHDPKILHIPAGKYNGFKSLEDNTIIIFYSTLSCVEAAEDDYRKAWDTWNIWEEDHR